MHQGARDGHDDLPSDSPFELATRQVVQDGTAASNESGRTGSGGPKSDEGKKVVSKNAVTHGIYSPSLAAGGESEEEWLAFYQGFYDELGPSGVPEEELVRDMAMTKWRLRRVIRAESADIDALFQRIDDPASYPTSPSRSYSSPSQEELDELEEGIKVLEGLRTPDSNADLVELDWASAIAALERHGGPANLIEPEEPWTRASFIKFATRVAEEYECTYEEFVSDALEVARDVSVEVEARTLERERIRQRLEREAILPTPAMQDRAQRAEAHLDKRFAKLLSQLELLQRMRIASDVPRALRIEVTD